MMLIGYSTGEIPEIANIGGPFGGRFLNGTQGGLVDGIPARVARLIWFTTAGNTSTTLSIPTLFAQERNNRIAAVLGLSLPVGTLMRVRLKNASTTVVAFIDQRAVRFSDGSTGAWFVFPFGTPASKFADLVIFNDVNGSALIAANQVFDIGEFAVMPAVDIELERGWSFENIDPSERERSRDSQLNEVARPPYRSFEGRLVAHEFNQAYAGGLADGMDLQKLAISMSAGGRAIAIPRWLATANTPDQNQINATATYGAGRLGKIEHLGGIYYGADIVVEQCPAN